MWDDEIEVADEDLQDTTIEPPVSSPKLSVNSVPLPRHRRSQSSSGGDFPPPIRRTSTDASGAPRPVPFAAKFQRVHPGTTGVTMLEHLERLDAVEASLQRLGVDEDYEEEIDVGEAASSTKPIKIGRDPNASSSSNVPTSPFSPPGSPLPTVPEVPSSPTSSVTEEDLVAMSKSMSHAETPTHHRWASQTGRGTQGIEWMTTETPTKRVVIVERLEPVNKKPLCACW